MPNDFPGAARPLLRLRGLGKRAIRDRSGVVLAGVDDISLEVAAGEVVALLGAGGASLLTLVAGFVRPDAGAVALDGRVLELTPPDRRGIGMLFPVPALFEHLNIAGNVGFGLPSGARDARVAEVLGQVGLAGMGARPTAGLPTAMAQRVALARAVAGRPRLLLAEAPFAALAAAERAELIETLRGLAHGGLGVLLATDDGPEALLAADRVVLLADGRLLQQGVGQALYDAPESLAAAQMLGSVNALAGRVTAIEDDLALVRLAGGAAVEALAMGVAAGDACMVALRPERIAVLAGDAGAISEGAVAAEVLELRGLGAYTRLRLRVGAEQMVVHRAAGVPTLGLVPGAMAALAWQAYQARAFPTG